ncbi:MAG: hypothetical protein KJN60_00065 [Boseongicola sp.]|nr:hypothetical protein [Boseongicola sp.]
MDDFARLEAKLAKLRQRAAAPGEGRAIRGKPEQLLSAIVTEIDETILPRELRFEADNASFALAVANRRLQALISVAPAQDGSDALAGKALSDAEDEALETVHSTLMGLLATATVWSISSHRQPEGGFPSDVGVPSGPLARAWKTTPSGEGRANPEAALVDYLGSLGDEATAWLHIEGEEVKNQSGPEDLVAGLGNQAAVFLDGYFSKKDMLFQGEAGPSGLVFVGGAEANAVLFLDCGGSMAFVLSSGSEIATLAQNWQARVAL